MKRLSFLCCLLIGLTSLSIQAQDKTLPEGLRKLTNKEMMDMGLERTNDLPTYGSDFKLLSAEKVKEMSNGLKYVRMFYVDKNGKLAAIVLKERSEEEKAMIAELMAEKQRMATFVGTDAKDFEVTDMAGNVIKLSELRGQVVAINFWFIGCKPCIMEMPELNEIVKEFEGKPVKFVAIALDKEDALKRFEKKRQFDYNIVPEGRPIAKMYEISTYPTHCIIDQEGKIAYFKSAYGPLTAKEITGTLEKLLQK